MKLSYEDHGQVTVLTVSGELNADGADAFRRACHDRFESQVRDIVLDTQYLALVDSAGLELLLWLREEAAQRGGSLRLVKPDDTVQKILELTRLDHKFDIHESLESAAKSLR